MSGPRFALRTATAGAHQRLDDLYSAFDLCDPADYGAFLIAHAPAFLPIEAALAEAGADGLVPGWTAGRRSACLLSDLGRMGFAPPAALASPAFITEAQVFGGLYVLEGSRLGGGVLMRSVPTGLPKKFLTPGNPTAWRAFVAALDGRLRSPAALNDAVASALRVFEVFERSARSLRGAARRDG